MRPLMSLQEAGGAAAVMRRIPHLLLDATRINIVAPNPSARRDAEPWRTRVLHIAHAAAPLFIETAPIWGGMLPVGESTASC